MRRENDSKLERFTESFKTPNYREKKIEKNFPPIREKLVVKKKVKKNFWPFLWKGAEGGGGRRSAKE